VTIPRSLRWKVTATIAAGGVVVAILAAGGFCALDLKRIQRDAVSATESLSAIVAEQVPPALALDDSKAAADILAAVRNGHLIQNAVLYDARGHCFASFHRQGGAGCSAMPGDGLRIDTHVIVVTRSVVADGERVGTLTMEATLPSAGSILRQFWSGAALIILLSCAAALALGVVLQARIAAPVLRIAAVAERISRTHRYSERVDEGAQHELGQLASSFNTMLDEIGRRDAQVAAQQVDLEEQVTERNRVNAELRQAKEKAEEAARLKSEFLANMSHEIRTPMNAVVGIVSLLLEQIADESQREQLRVAYTAASSLVTILNDILDLSKIEAGKLAVESVSFDLPATVRESVRIFEGAAREKGLAFGIDVHLDCPQWVVSDPVRLRQVLINLVGNAVKFTMKGEIRVTVRPLRTAWVRFEVRDTGVGVAPDKLTSIFEAFIQADGSHTRQFGGTGLGLTITRRLVHLLGGSVWAESSIGQGSTFFVDLPLPPGRPAEAPGGHPVLVPSPALRVLVAEDNPVNQRVVTAMLSRLGHSVTLAQNGEQAYRGYLANRFDLVLMDVQMPGIDGLEATRRIRAEEARRQPLGASLRRLPILALTAHASAAQRDQCLAAGMDGVLVKPVDLAALAQAIADAAGPPARTEPVPDVA